MIKITDGSLYLYFCYDFSEEIELDKIRTVLGKKTEKFKLYTKSLNPSYMQYSVPPLFADFGNLKLQFFDKKADAHLLVKFYNFGVVTLRFKVNFEGNLDKLLKLSYSTEKANIFNKEAVELVKQIKEEIKYALVNPEKKLDQVETYTIFAVRNFDQDISGVQLQEKYWKTIAKIVKQEKDFISESELKSTFDNTLSYYEHDLLVVDWGGAFVYDKSKDYEVLDVLEFALIQSLELRVYDYHLDNVLEKAYDDIGTKKTRFFLQYKHMLNDLLYIRLEITEVIDKVENSLKLVGEPFLAKVYSLASKKFYIDTWKSSVRSKLNTLEKIYESLSDQIQNEIMIVLEVTIVLLFVIDLVVLFWIGI
ncbi:MAG: hypothetical protein KKA62_00640 [Nanoarchaeota archaeon]|nr:hypothetical protein [Nanoarchaeota archaeon]MBU1644005.1 hypothetical protein [Nanoarchaeota archaeon]MBU1976441.1 hypothetical protein [Nanoarchaeota archaeon]